ncbi:MAG: flagellar biosynthesis anti-sigma factor FlgM [Gammaproteobacteria bacterium]|nr:flagellar biosynthesis anti-sigma factor FlgM [Gammaproteobacteria bacterium]
MTIDFNNPNLHRRVGESPFERKAGATEGGSAAKSKSESAATTDHVDLSANAQTLQSLEAKIHTFPEIDHAKVEAIRTAIAEGRYHVDPVRLAERFVALESELEA